MGISIDDEGMMMEDGGEMDLLYREKERRTRVNRYRESGRKSKKRGNQQVITDHGTSYTRDRVCKVSQKMVYYI